MIFITTAGYWLIFFPKLLERESAFDPTSKNHKSSCYENIYEDINIFFYQQSSSL